MAVPMATKARHAKSSARAISLSEIRGRLRGGEEKLVRAAGDSKKPSPWHNEVVIWQEAYEVTMLVCGCVSSRGGGGGGLSPAKNRRRLWQDVPAPRTRKERAALGVDAFLLHFTHTHTHMHAQAEREKATRALHHHRPHQITFCPQPQAQPSAAANAKSEGRPQAPFGPPPDDNTLPPPAHSPRCNGSPSNS